MGGSAIAGYTPAIVPEDWFACSPLCSSCNHRQRLSGAAIVAVPLAVIIAVAQLVLRHPHALEKQPQIIFIGDANATMHLYRLVTDPLCHLAGLPFGQADQ